MKPGLYDENDNLLKSWDELVKCGLDIERDHREYGNYRSLLNIIESLNLFDINVKLIIPDGITEIGCAAFAECANLISVTIPDTVESIDSRAFTYCRLLSNIEIPNSVVHIGNAAFRNCVNLKEVKLSNSIEQISDYLFYGCENLEKVTIPDSIVSIGEASFSFCPKLQPIVFPKHLETIGAYAFDHCQEWHSLVIPKSVKFLRMCIFANCKNLETVKVLNPDIEVSGRAFSSDESMPWFNGIKEIFIHKKARFNNMELVENNKNKIKYFEDMTLDNLIKEGYSITDTNKILNEMQELGY